MNLEQGKTFYLKPLHVGKLNINLTAVWGEHLKSNFWNWKTLYPETS